ncbi:hypothetical protein QTP86_031833 [Hemibagrus guttatus]|nr:hypothetical protein QTP86_031833 [Hemibagrus guttatus]
MESEAVMEESRTPLGPLTPSQQSSENTASLDFSRLTPSQFGITPNSFTAFPKEKDKSRVSQLKARRRSTIGLRGSPETNSLICFRAKQAMKTPPRTPQHLLESPLFSGPDSIKQKMAAFQRLMGMEEEKEEKGRARHIQFDDDGSSEERENRLAPVTPPLSKRRRRGTPHRSLWEEQIEEEPLSELTRSLKRPPQVDSSEFKSPEAAPSLGLGLDSQSQLMSFPMLSKPELIKTGGVEISSVSKKKRVRFGAPLSPEFFDKTLPPSTPLQKGATPACPPSSTGRKPSLLKTPQRFESPLPQPNFGSPGRNGASPVLTTHTYSDGGADCDEVFLHNQKISFPIMDEEYDNPPEYTKDPSHHKLLTKHPEITDSAVQEDEETLAPKRPTLPPAAEPEDQRQPQKISESSAEAPRSRGRKRKQPVPSETTETRRSSRSAAKSAKGKLKATSAKKRFGTKEVDRSLYGKRDYASKNPLLSPIIESIASSLSSTPATQAHTDTSSPATDEDPDSRPVPAFSTKASSPDTTADLVAAAALWRRRFLRQAKDNDSGSNLTDDGVRSDIQSEASVEISLVSADRRGSAGRAARGRRNSAGRRRRSEHTVREEKTINLHQSETLKSNQEEEPAGEPSASEKLKSEAPERGRRSARVRNGSVSKEEERMEEQRGAEQTCRDMVESSGSEREDVEMKQNSGQVEMEKKEKEPRQNSGLHEEVEKNDEDSTPASVPSETLESWQQPDFCIEDILKPVAKSRVSVRRSLRHRTNVDILAKEWDGQTEGGKEGVREGEGGLAPEQ